MNPPVAIFSLALVSGLGAVLGVFFGLYLPQGYSSSDVAFLLTLPSLCIGLGKSRRSPRKVLYNV